MRLEGIIAESGKHPAGFIKAGNPDGYINVLINGISAIASVFKGKPVWVRGSDIRSDEYRHLEGADTHEESNPMLGWHGIRRSIDEPEILKAELEAVKRLSKEFRLGIMFPQIISVEEVRKIKEIAKEVEIEFGRGEGKVEFGIMVETPAAVQIIEELCDEGLDFISFGTNDLTQFTLAIDRNNEKVQNIYDEMHPAILREIEHVIKVCKSKGVETSICGQAGSKPEMAKFLVKHGVSSISANIDAVYTVKKVVSEVEKEMGIFPSEEVAEEDKEEPKEEEKTQEQEIEENHAQEIIEDLDLEEVDSDSLKEQEVQKSDENLDIF
jgi:pyruvate,water dikinase